LTKYRSLELSVYTEQGLPITRKYKNFESTLMYNQTTGFMTFLPKPETQTLNDFYSSSFMRGEKDPTPEDEYTEGMVDVAQGVINHMNHFSKRDKWRIYDVGCGYGALVWAWQKLGHEAYGNELNPTWVKEANQYCNGSIFFGEITDGLNSLAGGGIDLFLISHVLEHVVDPAVILEAAASRLSENGLIYVNTPNTKCTRVFANGRQTGIDFVNFPMHLNFYTPASMKVIGESCGLKVIQMETRPFDEIDVVDEVSQHDFRYKKRLLGGELFTLFAKAGSDLANEYGNNALDEKIATTNELFPIHSW
jgi:SAM-dependent methyltransferase